MKVLQAFRNRHPVCAVLIGFFVAPAIMMAYLGRWKLALLYFVAEVALYFGGSWAIAVASGTGDATWLGSLALLAFRVLGAMHGYRLAGGLPSGHAFPWYARWYSLVLIFIAAPIAFTSLLFQFFSMPANSMYPTLQPGDRVVANKFAYGYGKFSLPFRSGPQSKIFARKPERGDLVVFASPGQPDIDYIKRVIGLPGDKVQLRGGYLYINGQAAPKQQIEVQQSSDVRDGAFAIYSESLPNDRAYRLAEDKPVADTPELIVPDGQYFVLGDNRNRSIDSRHDIGFVPEDNIFAKVALVLFNDRDGFDRFGWVN